MDALEHEAVGTGYDQVDSHLSCVLTRFNFRSPWALIRAYLYFRRVRSESRQVSGLLKSVFLIENLHTCYTLSLWRDARSILEFNTKARSHVDAANSSLADLRRTASGLQLWSAQLRFSAVSPHNLRWDSLDLSSELAAAANTACRRREASPHG